MPATSLIILAEDDRELARLCSEQLDRLEPSPAVEVRENGSRCIHALTGLLKAGTPPALVVLDLNQQTLGAESTGRAIRAVERGFEAAPTPIVLYVDARVDDRFRSLLSELGRTVHLRKNGDAPRDEQAHVLAVAIERLLAQLGGL